MLPRSAHTTRKHDAVLIHTGRVDDRFLSAQVLDEPSLRQLPLLYVVRRGRDKGLLTRVHAHCTNTFLVMRQLRHGFASGKIP